MKIIGIGHKRRRGKDTFACYLFNALANLGQQCRMTAFADPIRRHVGVGLFGLSQSQVDGDDKEAIDPYWNMAPREIMQKAGTECFRKVFGEDFWIKVMWRYLINSSFDGMYDFVLIKDTRFLNEARAIQKRGGTLIRVTRDLAADPNKDFHQSEIDLDGFGEWDYTVENNGTLEDLEAAADLIARDLVNQA